jgi:zinc D-Ala-D-Ala carboxypeptidase
MLSPNFTRAELSCPATGEYYHDPEFLLRLELLRHLNGDKPLVINSAHRSPEHNARVGGAPLSQHKKMAVDISLRGQDPVKLRQAAIDAGFLGIGMARSFLHVDLRRPIGNVTFPRDRLTQWYYGPSSRQMWEDLLNVFV